MATFRSTLQENRRNELTPESISRLLGESQFSGRVHWFDTIDSTNNFAKKYFSDGATRPFLVGAEEQTAGRGRFDRRWESEKGKNLTFSIGVFPTIPPNRLGVIPLCVGASVAIVVEKCTGIRIGTKWPNDLLIGGKKVCGILAESVFSGEQLGGIIVGIGLNVNQREFPEGIHATSLQRECGGELDRVRLLTEIVSELEWLGTRHSENSVRRLLGAWEQRSQMLGKTVQVTMSQGVIVGRAARIGDDGALIIDCGGEEVRILSGDVSIAVTSSE